ncbi:hypothetical protein BKA23_2877 [Rudaeicoccus suwonensis]|uniref:Prenyltransferase/squalene oxidase-like repeat protein n=2 Tax=Rudaeicoccus suwonensis TaxID=657409 RepID=A0A561E4G3_9MICO|nr:hypothetical protein BKA23_2877 [Rudaeicoccus suwonensis]
MQQTALPCFAEGSSMSPITLLRAGRTGTLALACAGIVAVAVAAPASAATPNGTTAAAYLTGRLAAGGGHLSTSGYVDYGLTIDAILALDAAGTGQSAAKTAAAYVSKNAAQYNTYDSDLYAGATAKLIVFAEAQGLPTSGYIKQLLSLEQSTGQFKDKSVYGDYSNTIGQSLAVIGFKRAGQPNAKGVAFLAAQQCGDGGFRISFTGTCTSDADATSMAVQALAASGGHAAAVTKAVDYLAGQQTAAGGVVDAAAGSSPNANSTGLAAVAFKLAGRTADAEKARSFVASLQYGCSFPAALRGGIAYDASSFAAQKAKGASATPQDSDTRSTAQAALAYTQVPYVAITAGGSATAPALNCSTSSPAPSTSPTSATGSGSASATTTGPVVVTDGGAGGSNNEVIAAAAVMLGGAAITGVGIRRRLRNR